VKGVNRRGFEGIESFYIVLRPASCDMPAKFVDASKPLSSNSAVLDNLGSLIQT